MGRTNRIASSLHKKKKDIRTKKMSKTKKNTQKKTKVARIQQKTDLFVEDDLHPLGLHGLRHLKHVVQPSASGRRAALRTGAGTANLAAAPGGIGRGSGGGGGGAGRKVQELADFSGDRAGHGLELNETHGIE